ncbi:MAG: response regulator [Flavobacteriaceae bacterium]|nr:response regulator [Flavobacteriaceae bacterium]PCI29064.1 MAG: response regulator [Candidatus Kaiserbacteria bacterium]
MDNKINLLVVEDEPFLRDLLLMKFKQEEIEVKYAADGESALEAAKESTPDAILLDLVLPGMSGFDVLDKLKEQDETKDIPVIILSNLGQEADIAKCKEKGAVDVLIKAHSSPSAIIKKVREIIEA